MGFVLSDFQNIRPRNEVDQEKLQEWIIETHLVAAKRSGENQESLRQELRDKMSRIGLGKERIEKRGIHLHDITHTDRAQMEIFSCEESPAGGGFTSRSRFFEREASQIFEQLYPEGSLAPRHLIHVTCTGYVAPSPAQKLVSLKDWGTKTTVTHAYHMGCYGAIPAIRMGMGFSSLPSPLPSSLIDIVHTEICSLHLHPLRHSSEQLLVQSLFGDGFIKYSVSKQTDGPHLKVLALHEEIIPDSTHCMTWRCEEQGLGMTLSKEIPVLIARAISGYLGRLCGLAGMDPEEVLRNAVFAIHPGGPKILHQIKDLLGLEADQTAHSVQVLKDYGNMSSATLPHIWQRMLLDDQVSKGTPVVSLAFGPGLSVSGGIFRKG